MYAAVIWSILRGMMLSYHPAVMFPIVVKLLELIEYYRFDLVDLLI